MSPAGGGWDAQRPTYSTPVHTSRPPLQFWTAWGPAAERGGCQCHASKSFKLTRPVVVSLVNASCTPKSTAWPREGRGQGGRRAGGGGGIAMALGWCAWLHAECTVHALRLQYWWLCVGEARSFRRMACTCVPCCVMCGAAEPSPLTPHQASPTCVAHTPSPMCLSGNSTVAPQEAHHASIYNPRHPAPCGAALNPPSHPPPRCPRRPPFTPPNGMRRGCLAVWLAWRSVLGADGDHAADRARPHQRAVPRGGGAAAPPQGGGAQEGSHGAALVPVAGPVQGGAAAGRRRRPPLQDHAVRQGGGSRRRALCAACAWLRWAGGRQGRAGQGHGTCWG